jgi:septal ring factor EnvC (AmiA/AmiB activator)
MQENTPITQLLVNEITRQNQGILTDLKETSKTIAQLTLEQRVMKDGHLELLMHLEKANEKINQVTVKLADANSEIARLNVALINKTTIG